MTELFETLPQEMQDMITSYIDMALIAVEPMKLPELISQFADTMPTEEASEFVDFYFKLRLEELRDGNNSNQW